MSEATLREAHRKYLDGGDGQDFLTVLLPLMPQILAALATSATQGVAFDARVEITLLRSRLRTIHLAGTHGMSNREVADRVAELENLSDQCRQYVQNAQQREHRINELEAAAQAAQGAGTVSAKQVLVGPGSGCQATVLPYYDRLTEGTSETCHRPLPCIIHDRQPPSAPVKEQPSMKRLPCGCLANNLSRCPVHDAP